MGATRGTTDTDTDDTTDVDKLNLIKLQRTGVLAFATPPTDRFSVSPRSLGSSNACRALSFLGRLSHPYDRPIHARKVVHTSVHWRVSVWTTLFVIISLKNSE